MTHAEESQIDFRESEAFIVGDDGMVRVKMETLQKHGPRNDCSSLGFWPF
ncbi:hypothetical protein SAMN05216388_104621 [Halorientalis persicus]|uniref:Uncharacterized protein n=1 Tax=Halorientalis persicus TaxID=1367881 RepID=A0A1H8W2E0_9EURY|nr:hypothetical protein SAMN05216388_104621 [Halorientalis persicus]